MNVLAYWLRTVRKNLTVNRLMNTVAIGSTAMALMIIGGILLMQQNVTRLFGEMKSQASVVMYLKDSVSNQRRQDIQSNLLSHNAVRSVSFRSKQEARKIVQNQGSGWDVLSGLDKNPLPASFHVSLKPDKVSQVEKLASKWSKLNGIESVDYPGRTIEQLRRLSQIAQLLLGVLGLIICLVAVFIIFNTIRLAVISRKDEIDILKLVGATKNFIGVPFVVEGILQGVAGSLVGMAFLWGLFWIVDNQLSSLPFFPVDLAFLTFWRLMILMSLGLVLGVIGSVSAVYQSVRDM